MNSAYYFVASACVVIATALAGFWDAKTGHIPNWLTLPFLVGGIVFQVVVVGWNGLIAAALGLVLCGMIPLFLFRQNAMGGGDVKLLAALGAWVGHSQGLEIQLLACILTALYSVTKLLWQGHLWQMLKNTGWLVFNTFLPKKKKHLISSSELTMVRFGLPIFFATFCIVVWQKFNLGWLGL